ncbi:MAG: iron-containing alcohol dehydrogenase [Desulfovibrio sp.]|jgi:3-deoxy-alpha-D-manno-octulosonate 8-oxidase|nr:iron-containing alcohol dehydrogenase [Desulfovibrio sp.]
MNTLQRNNGKEFMPVTRNTKNVPYYLLGFGAFASLGGMVDARRGRESGGALFYLDRFFRDAKLSLPARAGDKVVFVDTSSEPTVENIDSLTGEAKAYFGTKAPCCVTGIGGGSVLDTAKAVANLLTNPGRAEDYQGWELVKNPAVYKIGVPTLAGTGAECSRTCVLLNRKRGLKLGMNSDFTVYDQILLDPELTRSAPCDQFFFTGTDTFMHCFESLRGSYRNIIVDRLSETAVGLCRDIFLGPDDMKADGNLENMMVASYLGGMAAGNTGVVHPVSAALSTVLHLPHGKANCYALSALGDFYPEERALLMEMKAKNKIDMPEGICRNLPDDRYEALYQAGIIHENPLSNALGPEYKEILSRDRLVSIFKAM